MTGCTIENANSRLGGGIFSKIEGILGIPGSGSLSCTISGVNFLHCSASLGNLLGGRGNDSPGSMTYTVKSGCSVDGTEINALNYSSYLTPVYVYLDSDAGIAPFSP
jgi:hypothetical protein